MSPGSWILHVSSGMFHANFVSPLLSSSLPACYSLRLVRRICFMSSCLTLLFLFLFRWLSLVCLPSPFTTISSFSPLPHIPSSPHQGAGHWVCDHKICLWKLQQTLFNSNKSQLTNVHIMCMIIKYTITLKPCAMVLSGNYHLTARPLKTYCP